LDPVSSAIQLNFQYEQGRISGEKIKAIGDYFLTTLEAMSDDPHGHHEVVSLLSERERRQLRNEFNDTLTDFDLSKTLPALFEEQVVRSPESPALTFGDQSLTYTALNERSNQLAHLLIEAGIKPETVVGVCLSRSIDLVVALMAILKAGAAYLPLDPSYPEQRLSFMLADAQVPLVLTDEHHQSLLPPTLAQVICLHRDWPRMVRPHNRNNPEPAIDPSNLAYVIYTSGSTGKPKAAMNEHCAICNRLLWMQCAFELGPTDTVLQKTPYSFDVSVWEFFCREAGGLVLPAIAPPGQGAVPRPLGQRRRAAVRVRATRSRR
jgi:non-ribosomal peptide synthetase component F